MKFLRPEFAAWWQVLPVLFAAWGLRLQYVVRQRRKTTVASRFSSLSRRSGWLREATVLTLMLLTAGLMAFALMQPQALITRRMPEYERQDLVLMLDRSASMRAHDISP